VMTGKREVTGIAAVLLWVAAPFTAAAAQHLSQPIHESRSIRVDGERLHYLDFGGAGLPVLFTAGSRAADTWAGFAPRFADRHRVIAITHRGVPPSEGQETGYVQRARDILSLLDSLGFERAVLVGNSNPAPMLIYLAEHHPERVAGFVFLAPASEAGFETAQDPSGAMQMVMRAFLSSQGRDPDEAGGPGHLYRPRYFESGSPGISIPALTFVNRDGTRGLERVIYPLQVAALVADGTLQVPDSVARSYFERLAEDSDMQREVRAAWNTAMAAPMIVNEQAFARAFGENLRIVQLDVPLIEGVPVVTGYEYRDSPDLIESDIRRFLAEMTVREADTVHVAPPTGEREADRASILAALERVRTGGTVQFAAGTYRLGGRITVSVPGITLIGSAAGTTLRGCDPADLVAYDDPALRSGSCAGLELTGARQTVRNLTFEHITWASLTIMGGRDGNALLPATTGGHLIEGNTFRDSDSFNVVSDASEPIVIRDNTFINTYHAVAIQGRNVHFLDNVISAPEPGRIPYGRADIAIGIAQFAPTGPRCEDNRVVGNRIDGHPEGIAIGVFAAGASCRGNIVRGNTIAVGRATVPTWERRAIADWTPWAHTDSIAVGVAVRLLNYPRACDDAPPGPERGPMCPPGGAGQEALLSDNVIEGNRLLGGEGIAIEILYGSGNRIADNTIVGVRSWERFPAAVLRHAPGWARANGSGIWLSPGSDENEIVGNIFEDVASDAIVIEGDRNRVETHSPSDTVHDRSSGNRVSLSTTDGIEAVHRLTDRFIAAWNDDLPDLVERFYARDAVLTLAGGTVLEGRDAVVETFIRPNVARLRGMAPVGDPQVSGTGDTISLDLRYRARFAPAPDTVAVRVSNRWTLQPDGSWLITASTFELPSDNGADGPIRSRFVHSDGTRLHYLDFGGSGVPLVFIPSADRTAYTYIDFAARFTDRHRVLALTRRGSGQSGGEAGAAVANVARLARDVLALLDSLGIERAIVVDRWTEIPIHLAEQHPERLAGLVILRGVPPEPNPFELRAQDKTRLLEMYDRAGAAMFGADPDRAGPRREDWYEPGFRRTGAKIEVPTLLFVIESATPRWDVEWEFRVGLAHEVASDPQSFPDSLSRSYFQRLATDAQLQAEVQLFYQNAFAPAWQAAERAFFDAFSDHRIVRLDGQDPRSYYQYRDAADLIYSHVREFLDQAHLRERRRSSAAAPAADTVRVTPPTGMRDTDRASILAALDQVQPGGTVLFAPGTHLVGELIRVTVPGVTLQGHPDGTTLRGCDPEDLPELGPAFCDGMLLGAARQTVRGLTFEYGYEWLYVGCCMPSDPAGVGPDVSHGFGHPGGHLIEGNTFRNSGTSIRVVGESTEPIVIRQNRFVNTYHAIGIVGGKVHFLANDISAPEPDAVPGRGSPGGAISIFPVVAILPPAQRSQDHASCARNIIEGNRIQGHPEGVLISTVPGSSCVGNVVRDNTIIVRRTRALSLPPGFRLLDEADSTLVGTPLILGHPSDEGAFEDNLVEGNRIIGAEGVGIEGRNASRNRIVNNTITGVLRREPFPGNWNSELDQAWRAANGAGIWLSPGSDENEIAGNSFDDITTHAIVLEGDRNRVKTGGASDAVHDLGSGNRVTVPGIRPDVQDRSDSIRSRFFHSDGLRLHYLDFGGEGLPVVFVPALDRTADTFRDFASRFTDRQRVLAITNRGSGQSQGETRDQWDTAGRARDVVALLDTLGIQHAVVVGRWEDVPIYLAENHAERVAGLVILSPQEIGPSRQTLRAQDPTGVVGMVDRWALTAVWDFDPDQPAPWDDAYAPRYFQSDAVIGIPTLAFRGAESKGRGAADLSLPLELAELADADPERFPDAVSRSWFQRLRADPTLQSEVRAFYENVVDSAFAASERAFLEAFGDHLRIVRLDLEEPITGYEYQDHPDLFEAHTRSFLEEISTRQRVGAGEAAAAPASDTVHVAPPTGERDRDRASVLAALEQVRPGGTVEFAPGTYLIGGEIIRITVPRLTLLGHSQGTTLRGCGPDETAQAPGAAGRGELCNLLELAGARQTVRNLTFEHAFLALHIGCCWEDFPYMQRGEGGHLIEGNTFRSTSNAVRVHGSWTEPSIIWDNRFRNNWHSVAIYGNTVHLLDNDISALDPEEVPGFEFPWDAVGIGPSMPIKGSVATAAGSCVNNVVAGNRIEGNADGIMIDTGRPGDSCRNNVVRDNTIIVSRVRAPARLVEEWGLSEPTFIGTPIALLNYAEAFRRAGFTWTGRDWSRPAESDGYADAVEESFLEGNVIEGNRIVGAEGLGMEILYASGNRIANNSFTTISSRDPFPGNFLGPRPEMGVPLEWESANGSGIWVSPGSNGNEIVGNTFEEIAGAAVFLEGDRNQVETRSASHAVRDLGRDNRVGLAPPPEDPAEAVRTRTEAFLAALSDDSPTFVGPLFYAPDAVLVLSGGVVLEGLEAITREFLRPNVARLRGVRPSDSRLIAGRDTVTWIGAFRARFAPAADTVEAQLSNTWVRQPDGRWLIAASTLELPTRGDGTSDGPIRSRFFHSDGLRLHALDFGGEGVPLVFMPNRDRTAYTFIDFAPRFTDRARVLAVTSPGSGQSEGEADGAPGIAALGRDVIALLDSLGLQRAVVAHAWGEVLVYLAEQHAERVAGLIFLHGTPSPDFPRLWDEDPTGSLTMVLRLFASRDGADPDDAIRALREQWYHAQYLRTDGSIRVPVLVFVDESGEPVEDEQVSGLLALAREVAADPMSVPDPVSRDYFVRLSSDPVAQDQLRALYRHRVGPAFKGADDRFRRAFGEHLRIVPVEGRAIGYGYFQAPDLIEPQIRLFLEEVGGLERRRSATFDPQRGER
jgi:pimeloyl-ACP methyl ester carboxylesterase/ketosteroid isomerase-like protein